MIKFVVSKRQILQCVAACYKYLGDRNIVWHCWPSLDLQTYVITIHKEVDKNKLLLWTIQTGAVNLDIDRRKQSC
jgi:hypothetical protein